MRLSSLILSFVISISLNAQTKWEWTPTDTKWEFACESIIIVDWLQTRYMSKHPDQFQEMGPDRNVFGRHPNISSVNQYFIACEVLHPVIARFLPEPARRVFQTGTIILEVGNSFHNVQIGVRLGW